MIGALLLCAVFAQESALWPTPRISRIQVERGSVRLYGRAGDRVVGYQYGAGSWRRLAVDAPIDTASPVPRTQGDQVLLAPGYTLIRVLDTVPPSEDGPGGEILVLAVRSVRHAQTVKVTATLTAAEAARLTPGQWWGIESDSRVDQLPLGFPNGTWARHGTTVWFGLEGGFTEGTGGVGGLVGIDLETLTVHSVWQDDLLQANTTGLAATRDALWIGTRHPGEYGDYGRAGLLRYDPHRRTWTRYTMENSPLPSNLINALTAAGDSVWIATDRGVAVHDAARGTWAAFTFSLALDGDAVVHELVAGDREPDLALEGMFRLMRELKVPERAAFLRACRALPADRFAVVMRPESRADTGALADTTLVSYLREALGRTSKYPTHPGPRRLAAENLATLGDRRWLPNLRANLDGAPSIDNAAVALALVRLGDSTGYEWLHHALAGNAVKEDRTAILRVVGRLRDGGSVPALVGLMITSDMNRYAAYRTVVEIAAPDRWTAFVNGVVGDAEVLRYFLSELKYAKSYFPVADTGFDRAARHLVKLALLHEAQRQQAIELLPDWPSGDAVFQMINQLPRDAASYALFMPALVQATGTAVPFAPVAADSAARGRAFDFWMKWWHPRYPNGPLLAPKARGETVVRQWREYWDGKRR